MAQKINGILNGIFVASDLNSLVTKRKEVVRVLDNGLEGDKHTQWFRGADARAKHYVKGTRIWNSRQISIVSEEELKEIAETMKVSEIKPEWLGANICLKGIPRLTLLPPRTKIFIPNYYGGEDVGLYVTALNKPCITPGAVIQDNYPNINGLECRFPKAAQDKRGVVAVVERLGCIKEGSSVTVWVPDQYIY
ncbi:MAG: MOSC domain-containing protein [bacterium]|nr:MOSC domain-containing protein [bacterium]